MISTVFLVVGWLLIWIAVDVPLLSWRTLAVFVGVVIVSHARDFAGMVGP